MDTSHMHFIRCPPRNLLIWMILFQLVFSKPVLKDSTNETESQDFSEQSIFNFEHVEVVNSIKNKISHNENIDVNHSNKVEFPDSLYNDGYIRNDVIFPRKIQTIPSNNDVKLSDDVYLVKNHTSIENTNITNLRDNCTIKRETTTSGYDTVFTIILSVFLGTITIAAIIGNTLVIAAILLEKNLQSFQNYLTISLAVADLMVGLVVMPFGIYYQFNKEWTLGPKLCDFWTSSDVFCCTASILNLVAIAFDRYWVVTDCTHTRSTSRIIAMIVAVWSVSLIVAVAPQFGWKDSEQLNRVLLEHLCIPSLDLGYQIFSYTICILIPLPVILFLYWKIYQTARKSLRWREEQQKAKSNMFKTNEGSKETALGKCKSFIINNTFFKSKAQVESTIPCDDPSSTSMSGTVNGNGDSGSANDESLPMTSTTVSISDHQSTFKTPSSKKGPTHGTRSTLQTPADHPKNENENCNQEIRRENKTAMILAIITGAFMVCWLPFFIVNILSTRFRLEVPLDVIIILGWLAYFNSTINPIIYTIFSPEFRKAFKSMFAKMRCPRNQSLNFL